MLCLAKVDEDLQHALHAFQLEDQERIQAEVSPFQGPCRIVGICGLWFACLVVVQANRVGNAEPPMELDDNDVAEPTENDVAEPAENDVAEPAENDVAGTVGKAWIE